MSAFSLSLCLSLSLSPPTLSLSLTILSFAVPPSPLPACLPACLSLPPSLSLLCACLDSPDSLLTLSRGAGPVRPSGLVCGNHHPDRLHLYDPAELLCRLGPNPYRRCRRLHINVQRPCPQHECAAATVHKTKLMMWLAGSFPCFMQAACGVADCGVWDPHDLHHCGNSTHAGTSKSRTRTHMYCLCGAPSSMVYGRKGPLSSMVANFWVGRRRKVCLHRARQGPGPAPGLGQPRANEIKSSDALLPCPALVRGLAGRLLVWSISAGLTVFFVLFSYRVLNAQISPWINSDEHNPLVPFTEANYFVNGSVSFAYVLRTCRLVNRHCTATVCRDGQQES
eukprot:SAG11_NODE_1582_length_4646_cov_3.855949_4_plen_338_part_00